MAVLKEMYQRGKAMQGQEKTVVSGIEFHRVGSTFAEGGQAILYKAVSVGDTSREFLIKEFKGTEVSERLLSAEKLSQLAATNSHQSILASLFFQKETMRSVMLKAPSDTETLQETFHRLEKDPPQKEGSNCPRLELAIAITKSLLGALASIHKQGILHLDLSPCNVLYAKPSVSGLAGTVYLIDFNSAAKSGTVVDADQKSTLAFSSPEAREVGAVLSPCADLYSVGGLLLLLAVGEKASNSPRNAERWSIPQLPGIRNGNIRRPISNSPHIPAVYKELLCNIIVKSTTYEKDRYQSAAEMLADLCQLEDIIAGNGFHKAVIWNNSQKMLQRLFDESQLDPDLFEDIVPVDPQGPTFDDACTNEDILLLSPGGTGKTTALHRTWHKFLNGGPVPIFVDLAAFHGGEYYIHDEILKNYVASHDPIETQRLALDSLFANEQFILMLDGYNEAENPGTLDLEISGLATKSGISAILASRYLPEHSCFASWQRYTMEPLSDDIIEKKLAQSGKVVTIPGLRKFLNRPMYLSAFTRLPRSAVLPSTPGSILLESIRELKNRTGIIGHNEEYRLRDLAIEEILPRVSQSNAMLVSYSHMTQALEACKHTERFQRVPQNLRSAHHVIDSLCHMGILKRVDEEKYQYAHQNYRDLFAGLHLAKFLEAGRCPEQLLCQPIAPDLAGFIADMLCDATAVLQKVLSSFKGKRDAEAQQAVFNLIRILKIATHKRLSGICFDGLDLTMVDFQGIDISDSTFAAGIIPAMAVLRRGHVESVSHIFHIPGKNLILTYSHSEKRIFLWDENGNPVKTFSLTIGKFCGEIAVAVSPEYVALCNRYELEIRQIPSGTLVRKMFLPEQLDLKSLPMERLEKAGMQMDFAYRFANPLAFVGKKKLALRIDAYMVSLDVVTGKMKPYVLAQTDDPVRTVAASKDGVFMAGSKTVYNLNPVLGVERYRFETDLITKLQASLKGKYLALECDLATVSYSIYHEQRLMEKGNGHACVSDTHLVHWHLRDGVVIKNIKTGKELPKPELKDVTCACLSADKLFAATLNNELFVVDLKTGIHERHALGIRSEAYHDTRYIGLRGAMWSEAQRNHLPIDALNDGTVAKQIPGCCADIHQAEGFPMTLPVAKENYYSRFQDTFYIVGRKRYRLEVYSLKTGQLVTMARGLWDWCRAKPTPLARPCLHYIQASYIPRHKKLLAVTADGMARLWDECKETWLTLGAEPVLIRDTKDYPWGESEPGLCVVADSFILAVHTDGQLRAWDPDGQCIFSEAVDDILKLVPYRQSCLVIYGKAEDCRFRVFDTVKGAFSEDSFQGAVSSRLTPHSIIVMGGLEVEPEYRGDISMNEDLEIAFGGNSYLIYLSDPGSGMVAGDRVVFWDRDELRLYDRITGSRLKQIPWGIITQEKGTVLDRKLSADGSKFAFSFRNGNVYVLDLETEEIQKHHSITPASVAGADFRGATFLGDEKVKRILAEHGAITD